MTRSGARIYRLHLDAILERRAPKNNRIVELRFRVNSATTIDISVNANLIIQ
jgi:hypothetical protein